MFCSGINAKRTILIILFYIIFNAAFLMSIDYVAGSDVSEYPYGMSGNCLELVNDGQLQAEVFSVLRKYEKLTVVAETDRWQLIGLYDPDMYYYVYATKFTTLGYLRYFSAQDYDTGSKVGIKIDSIDQMIRTGVDLSRYERLEEQYDIHFINVFDKTSLISNNSQCTMIINLFALDLSDIKTLYFDSTDKAQLNLLAKDLSKYEITSLKERLSGENSIVSAIINAFSGKAYTRFMNVCAIVLYFLLLYTIMIYFINGKYIYIHRIVGATFRRILISSITSVLIYVGASGALSAVIVCGYLSWINQNMLTAAAYVRIQAFLLVSVLIAVLVKYMNIYLKQKKTMR